MRTPLTVLIAGAVIALAQPAAADHRHEPGVTLRIEIHGDGIGVRPHPRHGHAPHAARGAGRYEKKRAARHERDRKAHRDPYGPVIDAHWRERGERWRGGWRERRFLGHTPREIRHELRRRGFRHIEIDRDRHEFEIEAWRGGREFEMEVSRRTGRVTELEIDD